MPEMLIGFPSQSLFHASEALNPLGFGAPVRIISGSLPLSLRKRIEKRDSALKL
jgi:hypothetical protein